MVWLTFGVISLCVAAYAAVLDGFWVPPDLQTITETARTIILGPRRPNRP